VRVHTCGCQPRNRFRFPTRSCSRSVQTLQRLRNPSADNQILFPAKGPYRETVCLFSPSCGYRSYREKRLSMVTIVQ
jgi:hypothetical protein